MNVSCFVSMPFGRKTTATGLVIDFDFIYYELIKPAVAAAGLDCIRADEDLSATFMQRGIMSRVISSDVMIVDLTTLNPNVLYELGVRHALRSKITIVVAAGGNYTIPFDINFIRAFIYPVNEGGNISGDVLTSSKEELTEFIRTKSRIDTIDSPVYQYYPGLQTFFPDELKNQIAITPKDNRSSDDSIILLPTDSKKQSIEKIRAKETDAFAQTLVGPLIINILKAYRSISAWEEITRFVQQLPEETRFTAEVTKQYALALFRSNEPDATLIAIDHLTRYIKRASADAEIYSLLARAYRNKYLTEHQTGDLQISVENYIAAFRQAPDQYQYGLQALFLLFPQTDIRSTSLFKEISPQIEISINRKLDAGLIDYWDLASALDYFSITKNWDMAKLQMSKIMTIPTEQWMLETGLQNLAYIRQFLPEADQLQLDFITTQLSGLKGEPAHD